MTWQVPDCSNHKPTTDKQLHRGGRNKKYVPQTTFFTAGQQVFSWDVCMNSSFGCNAHTIRHCFNSSECLINPTNNWSINSTVIGLCLIPQKLTPSTVVWNSAFQVAHHQSYQRCPPTDCWCLRFRISSDFVYVGNVCIIIVTQIIIFASTSRHLSLSSRPSSSEGWRQQLSIPVSSSSIALRPLTFPLAECTCTPSNLLCRWSIVFLVCLDNVFLPCFLRVQSVLAVRPTALLMQCFT